MWFGQPTPAKPQGVRILVGEAEIIRCKKPLKSPQSPPLQRGDFSPILVLKNPLQKG
ncbi:hypothetical protein CGSSa00_08960 [Staphylococcus aureus subsp. aureus CGS00]|nr:hypothetical protein CGSSa00_08960 [Staphylococcus aureus subsp. aureus CGS00]